MTQVRRKSYRKRILAVDDAATILLRITDALEKYYDVVTVNSGARALRFLEQEKPDLILLDIRMVPNRADIPVIMLTGLEDRKSVMEGIKLGICDYVLKPFAPDDLLERIQRVFDPGKQSPAYY